MTRCPLPRKILKFPVTANRWMLALTVLFSLFAGRDGYGQVVDSNFIDGVAYIRTADTAVVNLHPYDFSDPVLNAMYLAFGIDSIARPFGGLSAELDRTFRVRFSSTFLIDSLIQAFEQLAYIEYAEKAPLYRQFLEPDDVHPDQYALDVIEAEAAWDISTGSGSIVIAIVDNAVSTTHEDLAGNIWINPGEIPSNGIDDDLNGYVDDINGWDVEDNDNNPNPPPSATSSSPFVHGTHCAGIASATTDNSTGIASIGYSTSIMAVKCSRNGAPDEGQSLPGAYDGVVYAMRAGADIISMSWGGSSGIFITGESIMAAAAAQGIVLVAAAGNSNTSEPFYPAAYSNVISVGSTNPDDLKSSFSNYGTTLDVMAPGFQIYSTLSGTDTSYGKRSGTSMACPLVAGICGLILSDDPSQSATAVQQKLKNGCEEIDALNPGFAGQMGAGRVNAYRSLSEAVSAGASLASASEPLIYPNPSSGLLRIHHRFDSDAGFEVFNEIGQPVASGILPAGSSSRLIDLRYLPPSAYWIRISGDGGSGVWRVVVLP